MNDEPKQPAIKDNWANGQPYEFYVGRWSRPVAREVLNWLAVAPDGHWLDVGCGTGALTQIILQTAQPTSVKGLDRSDGFLAYARQQVSDPRATFDMADAQSLPEVSDRYDAVVSGLMLNFVPQPALAVREMARVARPGGRVGLYVWDYQEGMQFMRYFWNTAVALDPLAAELDEGSRFPVCQPGPLKQLFQEAGLKEVETRAIDIPTAFKDFDDYWLPFLGGQGPCPTYLASLSEDRRTTLREQLRASLPFAPDGSIPLIARAWAVKGTK